VAGAARTGLARRDRAFEDLAAALAELEGQGRAPGKLGRFAEVRERFRAAREARADPRGVAARLRARLAGLAPGAPELRIQGLETGAAAPGGPGTRAPGP